MLIVSCEREVGFVLKFVRLKDRRRVARNALAAATPAA